MSHVFPRNSKSLPAVGTGGAGGYLTEQQGNRYLDGSGGAAVSCLGQADRDVIETIKSQLDSMAFAAAVLSKLTSGLVDTVTGKGAYLCARMSERFDQHAYAGDIRRHGDHVLLAPPFISRNERLDELVDKLGTALDKALRHVGL